MSRQLELALKLLARALKYYPQTGAALPKSLKHTSTSVHFPVHLGAAVYFCSVPCILFPTPSVVSAILLVIFCLCHALISMVCILRDRTLRSQPHQSSFKVHQPRWQELGLLLGDRFTIPAITVSSPPIGLYAMSNRVPSHPKTHLRLRLDA